MDTSGCHCLNQHIKVHSHHEKRHRQAFCVFWWKCTIRLAYEAVSPKHNKITNLDLIKPHICGITETAVAPHSSTLAWKIPWTEGPGGLQSMGSRRVGHDWMTSLSLFILMHWRRRWQPTPVFLPGESQGWRSLVGCRLWGRTELDTTEVT